MSIDEAVKEEVIERIKTTISKLEKETDVATSGALSIYAEERAQLLRDCITLLSDAGGWISGDKKPDESGQYLCELYDVQDEDTYFECVWFEARKAFPSIWTTLPDLTEIRRWRAID